MAEQACPKLKLSVPQVDLGNMSMPAVSDNRAECEPRHIDLVPPQRFGDVLRLARTRLNRSPEEISFASQGKFSSAALREFEAGDRRLSAVTVDDLVRCYGIARQSSGIARQSSGIARESSGIARESARHSIRYRLELDPLPKGFRPDLVSGAVDILCRFLGATQPAVRSNGSGTAETLWCNVVARESDLARLSEVLRIERGTLERKLIDLPRAESERLRAHRAEIAELRRSATLPVLVGYTSSTCLVLEPERLGSCEEPSVR